MSDLMKEFKAFSDIREPILKTPYDVFSEVEWTDLGN